MTKISNIIQSNLSNKEINSIIHAVIEPQKIHDVFFENHTVKILIQDMDHKTIKKSSEQLKEILYPMISTSCIISLGKY
ncbi:MAG: hypothetical protein K5798_02365 [Nitrosopumilus sp.]|uniref:hypothetical protein n=1 Tax=Nitrosopumilus sp. TaxID=2024843 RepID=UPI0024301D9E|nr:hypothetical protein [Nitrosopumilus sp.]MCV0366093.1 hypothetical protein [Nitrosopumilus sp.]